MLIFILLRPVLSAPIQETTNSTTSGWVPNPDGRGTLDILTSCVLTLSFCVWSAMHLNIPEKGETRTQYWLRNVKWIILGIIIPELVVLAAWRQWLSSRQMVKELSKILSSHDTEKNRPTRKNTWSIRQSFYAGMGGFVFDLDELPHGSRAMIPLKKRLTLTASGVLLLAKCGKLPDIDDKYIWDKSKADGLAKAVVVLQATWFFIQVTARLAYHQPVTLLEVNTVGHIVCAFVIYSLWWNKPRDVNEPTTLKGDWVEPLCAYMYMSSRISGKKPPGWIKLSSWIQPELTNLAWYPDESSVITSAFSGKSLEEPDTFDDAISPKSFDRDTMTPVRVRVGKLGSISGDLRAPPFKAPTASGVPDSTVLKATLSKTWSPVAADSALMQVNRRRACAEAIRMFAPVQELFECPHDQEFCGGNGAEQINDSTTFLKPVLTHLVTDTSTDWPSDHYFPGISHELMGMAMWFSSIIYGGIHMLAWGDYFPSEVEKVIWRLASTYVACSGLLWFSFCLVAYRWPWAKSYWDRFIQMRAMWIEYVALGGIATGCGLLYFFTRTFLVVDGVMTLRKLPNGAFETPDWDTLIPHF